jgi:beta-lactamase class A
MITRRQLHTGLAAGFLTCGSGFGVSVLAASQFARLKQDLTDIEAKSGGRLGVAMVDTETSTTIDHRGHERFPLCSTFKVLAAGGVLARVDAGKEQLDRSVAIQASDIVEGSPATKQHIGQTMTLAELCEAAMTLSDNTAGNLLLEALGGPAGLTAYARSLGDAVTRLDRIETDLNECRPGDLRDTTTPLAMCGNLRALVLGDALSAKSKKQLSSWLVSNQTGGARLRAGLPASWRVGERTGTGQNGTTNDVGIMWPEGDTPLVVAAYLTETEAAKEKRDATLAAVARAVSSSAS